MWRRRKRILGQQVDISFSNSRVRCRSRQRMEISISGSEEWRRRIFNSLFCYVSSRRNSNFLSGIGNRTEVAERSDWSVESSITVSFGWVKQKGGFPNRINQKSCWKIKREFWIFLGIGISSAVVSFNVALYYNTIIAWCLFYFVQSFQSQLPWAECPKVYFPNGSYASEPECVVSYLHC